MVSTDRNSANNFMLQLAKNRDERMSSHGASGFIELVDDHTAAAEEVHAVRSRAVSANSAQCSVTLVAIEK